MFKNYFSKNFSNVRRYRNLNFIDFYQKEYLPKMYLLKKNKIPFNEQYETKDMKIINKNIAMKNSINNIGKNQNSIKIWSNKKIPYKEQHELRDFGKQRFIDNDKLIDIVKKHI